jgi:hypothetical protein
MIRRIGSRSRLVLLALFALSGALSAAIFWTTLDDFHVPGTQVGDVGRNVIAPSDACANCHAYYDYKVEPYFNWSGSLMGQAGRDPLFMAQMTNANQDVANVGNYCLRCHVPNAILTGSALQPDGSTLSDYDREGVMCHFCHSMVDPIYKPGISPVEDLPILAAMPEVPAHYGNAMFVIDPTGSRRGPRADAQPPHELITSAFHRSGDLCGTCHDVGNVATTRQPDGSFSYNQIGRPSPTDDPQAMFPLERTYTEWKLSAFANGGVDMAGRFGGTLTGPTESCQDCHMPGTAGQACYFGPERRDVRRHSFAGAAAQVLDLIAEYTKNDQGVDQRAIRKGREHAVEMLEKAASLRVSQDGGGLCVRVTNESGHKLPTGHIEGRRVWLSVKFFDANSVLLRTYGHYDEQQAELDEPSTRVYEMVVGLSGQAAQLTGLPAGPTGHMSLADTIVKDNRIPPRGFSNAAYEAGGAPVVAHSYADGQYWDEAWYTIPPDAASVAVEVNYQNTPRHYIEELRNNNVTDDWGRLLHELWMRTGRGAPITMASANQPLAPFLPGDVDGDGVVTRADLALLTGAIGSDWTLDTFLPKADLDGDHTITRADGRLLAARIGTHYP